MKKSVEDIFAKGVSELRQGFGFNPYPPRLHIQIPDAREQLAAGLRYYLGDKAKWLPAYDEVSTWLTDNQHRGLLCVGQPGLGKTLICQNIIPVLIQQNMDYIVKNYTALNMQQHIDEMLKKTILSVDDIGTEPLESVNYGVHRVPFSELVDQSERQGTLLILTTNLRTSHGVDKDGRVLPSIEGRYGIRTYDRLCAVVKSIVFKGKSFRK